MSEDELKVVINNMIGKLGQVHDKMSAAIAELRQAMEELEDAFKSNG